MDILFYGCLLLSSLLKQEEVYTVTMKVPPTLLMVSLLAAMVTTGKGVLSLPALAPLILLSGVG